VKAHSRLKKPVKKTRAQFRIPNLRWLKHYFTHLPTLILSLPFYYASYYILNNVYPDQIKNLIIPNTYLPLQLALFIANLFFFSFLFLKTRRGLLTSLMIAIFLFLKLQAVIFDLILVLGILFFFVIIELTLSYFDKKI